MTPRNGETHDEFRARVNKADRARYKKTKYTRGKDGEVVSTQFVRQGKAKSEPPANAIIKRVSTLYDSDGDIRQQWVIQTPEDQQREELLQAWFKQASEAIPARPWIAPPVLKPLPLLVSYPIGDHHLGMLAWKHEVGVSNDIELAEALLTDAMNYLVGRAPEAENAIIAVLGDFFHYDSFDQVTPTNRNLLDADGRAPKMISAGFRLMENIIDRALAKHNRVHIICELGNHDPYTSMILAQFLARVYRDNERVTVDISPGHFHYFEWANNLFGTHHGHGRAAKPAQLPQIMAADRREAWGRTQHHYWYTGHIHQQTVYEYAACKVESFPILPPADAYAYNEGYRSQREMKAIIYHAEYGEIGRVTVNPEMMR
jgi:hypothetical protein